MKYFFHDIMQLLTCKPLFCTLAFSIGVHIHHIVVSTPLAIQTKHHNRILKIHKSGRFKIEDNTIFTMFNQKIEVLVSDY